MTNFLVVRVVDHSLIFCLTSGYTSLINYDNLCDSLPHQKPDKLSSSGKHSWFLLEFLFNSRDCYAFLKSITQLAFHG